MLYCNSSPPCCPPSYIVTLALTITPHGCYPFTYMPGGGGADAGGNGHDGEEEETNEEREEEEGKEPSKRLKSEG